MFSVCIAPFPIDKSLIDVCCPVNNAGYVLGTEHVGEIAEADIEGMFSTNVFGLIAMTQLLLKGAQYSN